MILFTVGTHTQPFDRLVKAADQYAAKHKETEIIIQKGVSTYECKNAISFDFCHQEDMQKYSEEADIIVMQGGWGAMREAIDKKKKIIAVPRIEGLEHIHNQEQVVRKLESLGCVLGVYNIEDLEQTIEKAKIFDFKPLVRGNANIIKETLERWFNLKSNK